MSAEVWFVAGGLALGVVQFGYQIWKDTRDDDDPTHDQGAPPAAAA